jgi:hypothetical protein
MTLGKKMSVQELIEQMRKELQAEKTGAKVIKPTKSTKLVKPKAIKKKTTKKATKKPVKKTIKKKTTKKTTKKPVKKAEKKKTVKRRK